MTGSKRGAQVCVCVCALCRHSNAQVCTLNMRQTFHWFNLVSDINTNNELSRVHIHLRFLAAAVTVTAAAATKGQRTSLDLFWRFFVVFLFLFCFFPFDTLLVLLNLTTNCFLSTCHVFLDKHTFISSLVSLETACGYLYIWEA